MYCSVLLRYSTGKIPTEFRGNGTPDEQKKLCFYKNRMKVTVCTHAKVP